MIRLVNIFILLFVCHCLNAKNTTFPTLEDLDKVVANQQIYTNARLRMLDSLKSDLRKADDLHKKYAIEKELFAGYQSFVVDSALLYAQKKLSLAQRLNDAEELSYSYLDVASMLIKGGNYKEANEVLQRLNVRNASSNLRNYYYTVNQDLYTTLQTVSLTANERKLYNEKSSLYKDSILSLKLDPSVWVVTDRMMDKHRYKDALQILLKEYPTLNVDDRRMAYVAYSISDIYRLMGNREKEKQYLIVSAIADIKSAVKEYISLRRLATLLYEDGDIERSYLYMKRAPFLSQKGREIMSNLTKRALEASLKKLLLKKPLDKITISDIADDCGMNRMTFYYHFQDIYDLIDWSFAEEAEKILAGKKSYETWQEGYLQLFLSILENKPLIMNVYRTVSREQLEQYLFKVSYRLLRDVVEEEDKERVVSEEDKDFIAKFYKYAYVGLILDWIQHDMKENPEKIISRMSLLMQGNFARALEAYSRY